jgi:predicted restriction endonuclease
VAAHVALLAAYLIALVETAKIETREIKLDSSISEDGFVNLWTKSKPWRQTFDIDFLD